MKATIFDDKFDNNEDIIQHLDILKVNRPGIEQKRVNVDLSVCMINSLDNEAKISAATEHPKK